VLFVCFAAQGLAQSESEPSDKERALVIADVQLGVVAGGEISSEQFIYKPGLMMQVSVNRQLSPYFHAGIGAGLMLLESESIIPVFVDFKAYLSPEIRSNFIAVDMGYSGANSSYYNNLADYDYRGGLYFSTYYGFQIPVSDDLQFLISAGYIHQALRVDLSPPFTDSFTETFSMDFLSFRAGIRF